jgi:hypothetical protein
MTGYKNTITYSFRYNFLFRWCSCFRVSVIICIVTRFVYEYFEDLIALIATNHGCKGGKFLQKLISVYSIPCSIFVTFSFIKLVT